MAQSKIKTFEDACKALKIKPSDVVFDAKSEHQKREIAAINALAKLTVIARALNGKWQPDWTNYNQWKYYPWLRFAPGVGFSFNDFVSVLTGSSVGSRLCYKDRETAQYAAEQFKELYNDLFISNQTNNVEN